MGLSLPSRRPPLPRYRPAFDPLAGQLYAAIGLRRMLISYTGPLIRGRRQSDGAVLDFGYAADGWLDTAGLLAWAGASTVFVSTVYDQTGTARHAGQSTTSLQPRIVNNGVLDVGPTGRPVLVFDGGDDFLEFQGTTAFAQNQGVVTIGISYRRAGPNGSANNQNVLFAPTNLATRVNISHQTSAANALLAGGRRLDGNNYASVAMPSAAYTLGDWTRAIARPRYSAAQMDAVANGSVATGAFQTAGVTSNTAGASGVRIGATHLGQECLRGEVTGAVLAQSALDIPTLDAALAALNP